MTKPAKAKELSMSLDLSISAIDAALTMMPIPFYRIVVSPDNRSDLFSSILLAELFAVGRFRFEKVLNEEYEYDEWSLQLCLRDNGAVTILKEVWTQGA